MRLGFSDFSFFMDQSEVLQSKILNYLLKNNIRDLRFGLNLIQVASKYKYGDINILGKYMKRLNDMGFNIHVYFFFSDDVANAAQSRCPSEWAQKDSDEIARLIEADCSKYIDFFEENFVEIKSYTLGNEVEWGICGFRPNEKINAEGFKGNDDFQWLAEELWSVNAKIIDAASRVIRERQKNSCIVIHSDSIGNKDFTYNFFKCMTLCNVDFDVIGLTYNPWTIWDNDLVDFTRFKDAVNGLKNLSKPIWIVEYAYPKTLITNGELTSQKPNESFSYDLKGQTAFHKSFLELCKQLNVVDMVYFWRGEHQKKNNGISWQTGVLENDQFDKDLLEYLKITDF